MNVRKERKELYIVELLSFWGIKRGTMSKLRFPIEFLDVLTLQDRWQCSLNIIQALAELKEIHFFVRPVVLEIALEGYHRCRGL